jgi:AbrB family looped-hinge helix DNA binding protein
MSTTISTKYQIVIPKAVRKQLGIRPGQKMQVEATKDGNVLLKKDVSATADSIIDKYAGSLSGVWRGEDPAQWLRKDRDASDD